MNELEILKKIKKIVWNYFESDATGHDYFHTERVVNNAKLILKNEKANEFLVELASWLHDVGDYKLNDGTDKSEEQIKKILIQLNINKETQNKVIEIVNQVSFSKGKKAETIEAKIVQDADRLDAIGAIGIARAFAYGGSKNRKIFNPNFPLDAQEKESTIAHFHDKLLKIKSLINTETAKEIAEKRHSFLLTFLKEFESEVYN